MSRPGGIPSLQLTVWAFLLTISSLPHPSRPDTDTFVYGGCSQLKYTPGSPYLSNINSLLTSLVNSATYSSYSNFTVGGPSPQDVVYGLYQCRGDLSMPNCAECVSRAVSQLGNICSFSRGAVLQLQGCVVKYDNTYFLGVEDKTVVVKKCGPSIGGYAEAMDRRDAVLAGLANGGGPYRVGGAGNVQGVAQCVGDLSPGECQDCVSDAIGRLRSDCAMAVSGDVFLAKCYARYSSGEDHSGSNDFHDHDYHDYHESHHDSDNNSEKTLAIIIGLLAGVALLVLFLSFLGKWCRGGKGK